MINLFKEDIKDIIWSGITIIIIIISSRVLFLAGKKIIDRILKNNTKHTETLRTAFNYILSILIWIIAITLILPEIGIEFSALIASAGIIGLFLSFGTGSLIKDFFSGMIILFEDHFDIGDEVEVKNLKGKVVGFDLRKTTLSIVKGKKETIYFIPNSEMTIIANLSKKKNNKEIKK